jgi:NAD+ synthetase
MIDYSKFVEGSRNFLKNYLITNKLKSCVIGISGGIDSTISCAIASPVCKELGIPLIGRSLPTGTNKQKECDVADLVGNAFCNDYKVVALDNPYLEIFSKLEQTEGSMTNLQKGNIKARLRMIYLRHLASIHKGVVLDNDNFTEWNLGFWTIAGDQFDVNLGLHYLWKTEIYELANYLQIECSCNRQDYCVSGIGDKDGDIKYDAIHASIKLIPTDGNGVSNSDCEQFGLDNYEQVDDVLKTMYYSNTTKEEYIRLIDSYNEQGVDKVMMLHQNTAYKRKELPIKPTKEELGL